MTEFLFHRVATRKWNCSICGKSIKKGEPYISMKRVHVYKICKHCQPSVDVVD